MSVEMTDKEKISLLEDWTNELKEALHGTIREKGYYSVTNHKWEINYSSILTKLIQETGRFCENYASDLFIQWKYRIDDRLENGTIIDGTEVFAIRENSVDNKEQYEFHKDEHRYYRAVWFLDIKINNCTIEMVLHK